MKRKWQVRRYRESADRDQILTLRSVVMQDTVSGPMSTEKWDWQFMEPPAGKAVAYLAVVCLDGHETIVGQYVVIPVYYYLNGRQGWCSLSMDTMTHPDYHRQGIFTVLAKAVYRELAEKNNVLTFGFANDNSFPGFVNKLDWYHICDVPMYVKVLKSHGFLNGPLRLLRKPADQFLRLLFRSGRYRAAAGAVVEELAGAPAEADRWAGAAARLYRFICCRNRQFMEWRFFTRPDSRYRVFGVRDGGEWKGYIVLDTFQYRGLEIGAIVDVFVYREEESYIRALLDRADTYFAERGVTVISTIMLASRCLIGRLKAAGFRRVPNRINPKKWHFIVRDHLGKFDRETLTNPDSYYITWADTDVI